MTKINIIIPSLGNKFNIETLLRSISLLNLTEIQLSIIIILNGVDELQAVEIRRFELSHSFKISVERLAVRGVNRARNRGIDLSSDADLLFFLDDDCEFVDRSILQRHVLMHKKYDRILALGGGYLVDEQAGIYDRIYNDIQMTWLFSGLNDALSDGLQLTNHLIGGNFSIKFHLMKEHRLRFDESIVYGGSEHEFFKQALQCKQKLAYLDSDVIHHTSEKFYTLLRKIYRQGRGKAQIDSKYPVREIEEEHRAQEFNSRGFGTELLRSFFNYCFWTGYYSYSGKSLKIIFHLVRDLINFINFKRFEWLKRISKN